MELQLVLLGAALAVTVLGLAGYVYVLRGRIKELERQREALQQAEQKESEQR